jgi:hypothetical protein
MLDDAQGIVYLTKDAVGSARKVINQTAFGLAVARKFTKQ